MDIRAETPEPSRVQGRRNVGVVQLLDDEGNISDQLEKILKHIFAKYCVPPPSAPTSPSGLLVPPDGAYLSQEGLDKWATDTNGHPFTEETKEELVEFLDITESGQLTCVLLSFSSAISLTWCKASKASSRSISYKLRTMRRRLGEICPTTASTAHFSWSLRAQKIARPVNRIHNTATTTAS
ncbi:hypothetical protein HMN09_00070200 [Mycena chlorophos]|uniref:Uncharacterized protein n=1 Tax=Mycena chlorophos TaxID=658473 RepID=A0A8H6WMK4_MYCCL|nr:hypothetical protein HMN09_00070200 [Mycena chlorophos]